MFSFNLFRPYKSASKQCLLATVFIFIDHPLAEKQLMKSKGSL